MLFVQLLYYVTLRVNSEQKLALCQIAGDIKFEFMCKPIFTDP